MKKIAKKALRTLRNAWRFAQGRDDISIRESLGHLFLKGSGIEIGALHNPMSIPANAQVNYVDRLSTEDLFKHYPEMRSKDVVKVDIISEADRLEGIADSSQDFVIANHVLEHCENPVLAIQNMLRVLRPTGRVFLAIPDLRFTFDHRRTPTTIEHLMLDYREGSHQSRAGHYLEWTRDVLGLEGVVAETEAARLMSENYSIHFHTWKMGGVLEMLSTMQSMNGFGFEIEMACRNGAETLIILGKNEQPLTTHA